MRTLLLLAATTLLAAPSFAQAQATSPYAGKTLVVTSYPSNAEVHAYLYDLRRDRAGDPDVPDMSCRTPCTLDLPAYAIRPAVFVEGNGFKSRVFRRFAKDADGEADFARHVNFIDETVAFGTVKAQRSKANTRTNTCDEMREASGDAPLEPCYRPPPFMPPNAQRSGRCEVHYDVGANGVPAIIRTTKCSDEVFRFASGHSIKYWRFHPALQNGKPAESRDEISTIVFQLTTPAGKVISEDRRIGPDPLGDLPDFRG